MPPKTVKKTYAKGWNKIGSRIRIPGKGANPEYEGILAFAGVTNPPLNPDKPDTKWVNPCPSTTIGPQPPSRSLRRRPMLPVP